MSFFDSLNVSASALTAQRLRMDVLSENIANVDTTRGNDGQPYKRKIVMFQERSDDRPFTAFFNNAMNKSVAGRGVRATRIIEDDRPGSKVYEPSHPDADEDGYVEKPNVNVVEEMVNMISASRSYEANVTSMNITKAMMAKTLEISK